MELSLGGRQDTLERGANIAWPRKYSRRKVHYRYLP